MVPDASPPAAGSRFRRLFLLLGLGLLLFAAYLWQHYFSLEGDLGIVAPILVGFNSLVTLIGLIIFGRALRRPGEPNASE